MKALYDQKIIDSNQITFWLNFDGAANSYATLGGVPEDSSIGETFSQDLVNRYDQWWTVKLHDVSYGDSDIKASGMGYAILDTGTSLMYIGKSDYYNFLDKLLAAVPDFDCTSRVYCFTTKNTCDVYTPSMSSFMFQLQENYYTLPPAAYTFSTTGSFGRKQCTVAISY